MLVGHHLRRCLVWAVSGGFLGARVREYACIGPYSANLGRLPLVVRWPNLLSSNLFGALTHLCVNYLLMRRLIKVNTPDGSSSRWTQWGGLVYFQAIRRGLVHED